MMNESLVNSQQIQNIDGELRRIVARAIHRCPKSRDQIADELTRCVGATVTVHMLNNYTAEGKRPARFPAAWVLPFCVVTNDDSLQRLVLGPRLAKLLELGEKTLAALCDRTIRPGCRRGRDTSDQVTLSFGR
jgi:hypothetical protein